MFRKNKKVGRRDFLSKFSIGTLFGTLLSSNKVHAAEIPQKQTKGLRLGGGALGDLVYPREGRRKRISSWDRRGGNFDWFVIPAGKTATLAQIKGAGCITHIWLTARTRDDLYLRKCLLKMFWDGEKEPSVECPLGDFFGVGHARVANYWSLPLSMTTGGYNILRNRAAMNTFFPMPFSKGALIQLENQGQKQIDAFYFYIDYEEYQNSADDLLRFHAQWRRENPTPPTVNLKEPLYQRDLAHRTPGSPFMVTGSIPNLSGKDNYVILEAKGRGHYVGCNLSIDNIGTIHNEPWFGEGDDMIFIDGDKEPTLRGTGTEDYFCDAWGYNTGRYSTPFYGVPLTGETGKGKTNYAGKWTMFRYHIVDPIMFNTSIKVTIEHGQANVQSNDYSSAAYWYQTEPHAPFPKMLPVKDRMPRDDWDSYKKFIDSLK